MIRVSHPLRASSLVTAATALLVLACTGGTPSRSATPPAAAAASGLHFEPGLHFEIGALDPRVDPCTDFYDFACGGWRATHPIPADRTRWSRYSELDDQNLARERSIVDDAVRAGAGATPASLRVGAYYAACMDEPAIDARGLAPVHDVLARIDAVRTSDDAMAIAGELRAHGVLTLLDAYVEPDSHDVKRMLFTIDRGALGMGARDDYGSTDPKAVTLRARYREYLVRLFRRLDPAMDAAREADRVVAFETALAKAALSPVEERDPDALYHPMTVAELRAKYPAIAWSAFFAKIGAPSVDHVNLAVPAWTAAVSAAIASPDLGGLRAYLRATTVRSFRTMLPRAIREEVFEFVGRALRGAKEMPPRWKQCLSAVDDDLGDDVGRIFLARYFGDDARARMKTMTDALLASFHAELESNDWLGPQARAAALAKLSKELVRTGASERMRAYDGLTIDRADPFGNTWRARAMETARTIAWLDAPTDRERFFDPSPQTLDGFSAPRMNGVGFTAAFLQPPVFDPRMDDAVNFGGLGSVIGHELTHQFDDEGRKFDDDGNLKSWWAPDDVARFEARAQCFIDEYGRFHADDGTPLDGKLTLGENLADNGGIRLSYGALRPSETGPKIDGFTPAQRFFIAWGQIRCENVTPETARRQAQTDPHSAGRWRVDGVVPNMPEFARAFTCPAGAPMAPEKRCKLW